MSRSNALPAYDPIPEGGSFCRRYGPVKDFDEALYRVTIENGEGKPLVLSLDDLRTKYPRSRVVAALQCAASKPKPLKELTPIHWDESSISNCIWGGVLLRDVLKVNLEDLDNLHVCFASYDTLAQESHYFGGSIPLQTALSDQEDVLLAFEKNDAPLSAKEGGPIRVVAPGFLGARWVKWLDLITVSRESSQLAWNQLRAIRDIPLKEGEPVPLWRKYPTMTRMPTNTVIASIQPNGDKIKVKGFGIGRINAVELSTNGKIWHPTTVTYQDGKWSWTLFEGELEAGEERMVYNRAKDVEGNVQTEESRVTETGAAINSWGQARW